MTELAKYLDDFLLNPPSEEPTKPTKPVKSVLSVPHKGISGGKSGLLPVYSEVVGEVIYFADDRETAENAPAGAIIYDLRELRALLAVKPEPDALRRIHYAKREFEGRISTDGDVT